jgi:hypothetical protein
MRHEATDVIAKAGDAVYGLSVGDVLAFLPLEGALNVHVLTTQLYNFLFLFKDIVKPSTGAP